MAIYTLAKGSVQVWGSQLKAPRQIGAGDDRVWLVNTAKRSNTPAVRVEHS